MKTCLRSLLALAALLPLVSCDKPEDVAAADAGRADPAMGQTQEELAAARDALQRQALEIETRTALMDKQLADMAQALKEQENAGLRRSLDDLKRQNDELRSQAESARRQSNDIGQRLPPSMPAAAIPVASSPADYSLFYERLTPHGRWFDVSGYGYCWRPTVTTARWRPYVDGCWSWSSLGWTWQSNEPFGWIVYHYGRWVNLAQYGWVWVPGSEWAPAWVSWRQSRDYVGWAPLPPDPGPCAGVYRDCDAQYNLGPASYVFITTNHFVQPSYTSVCAPVTQNTGIFQSSVNVTQIVRCDDRQRPHVFKHHGGPPRAQMEQACAHPVQQVQVQTTTADQIPQHRPGHHREPSRLQQMIVDFSASRKEPQPSRPKITDRIDRPKRVDAFEGLPQRVAHQIRETIAEDRASAAVQQEKWPSTRPPAPFPRMTERQGSQTRPDTPRNSTETVRPAIAVDDPAATTASSTPAATPPALPGPGFAAGMREHQAQQGGETRGTPQSRWKRPGETAQAPAAAASASAPDAPPAVVTTNEAPAQPPAAATTPPSAATPVETTPPQPSMTEKTTADAVAEAERRPQGDRHREGRETPDGDAEKRTMPPAGLPEDAGQGFAMRHRQQQQEQEAQQRAAAAKMAAEQAQASAETERTRQQAEAAAMQQRQSEEQAAQQRAAAEKMAVEEAKATAEQAERVRQQAEAVQMQRQQEETARRAQEMAQQQAAEQTRREQEMAQRRAEEEARAQAEAEMRRSQEMAQKQAEEQARRAAEEQMRREQEMAQRRAEEEARRAAEEQMRRAQEMAQRQAEEQARRAAEEQMRREQEMAQRRAEEDARRQAEEQMRRAQEMAQRQAEEQARRAAEEQMRRAQEEAQRAAQEAARRAAEEAARNQPQPQNPGS